MGLEEVKEGLEQELEQRRDELLQEAEEEKESLMEEAEREVEEHRQEAEKETEEIINKLERSEVASTNLRLKKKRLNVKKHAIDSVFKAAKEKLVSAPPKEREGLLQDLVEKAEEEIEVGLVYCSSKDEKLIDDHKVQVDEEIDGGVVCESEDEQARVDLTYDALLREIREENLKEVAEELFG